MPRHCFFIVMKLYHIDIVRSFQILILNEGATILGVRSREVSNKDCLPQIVIQDPTVSGSRNTPTKVGRCIYSVYFGGEPGSCPEHDGNRVYQFTMSGRFNASQFRFLDFFRYSDRQKHINYWGVYVELFPDEVLSASSSSPVAEAAGPIQNYAEGSLLRTIT